MKVLQIGLGNVQGGLEAFVMNYYRELAEMNVQFDFICMYDKIAYEEEILRLGGRVYYVPNVKKDCNGYKRELERILRENRYDAVHVNMLSAANIVPLQVAHKAGVPKIIAHSHSSSCPGVIRNVMNWCNRPFIGRYATDLAACGQTAGEWMFGKKQVQRGNVTSIQNAIQAEKFLFSKEVRDSLRKEMGWENKLVIGHVGRFDIPKNHLRMLSILDTLLKKRNDVVLCFVGENNGLYEKVREKTAQLGLGEAVYFAGRQEHVSWYLSAMDVFLFPSLFEGTPFALVEAQTNGLACVMSDRVSEEGILFPDRVRRLSLDEEDEVWADVILKMSELDRVSPNKAKSTLQKAHFDIKAEAKRLKNLYEG